MKKSIYTIKELYKLANTIRLDVLNMSYKAQVGHVGSAFSVIEILVTLYFKILTINSKKPNDHLRDIFILSKGHAANALYPILSRRGFFPRTWLSTYCQDDGRFGEHPETPHTPGIEWPTGSLGHGLSVGSGIAYGMKYDKINRRCFVLLSDAECDEGEVWEAALFAGHHKLNNLIAIVDYNSVQALGKTDDVLSLHPFDRKWKSFGWNTIDVDGHNIRELIEAFSSGLKAKDKPTIIIAHTIRGKNVSFMEHIIDWHYLTPTKEHIKAAKKELHIHA